MHTFGMPNIKHCLKPYNWNPFKQVLIRIRQGNVCMYVRVSTQTPCSEFRILKFFLSDANGP